MSLDAAPYLTANYAPMREEATATDLEVTGALPVDLEGRLLRNGPNPIDDPDVASHHWFLGDGMVHGIRFRGGRAEWYRNRFVGSERNATLRGGSGSDATIGPNTNVIGHAGTTYAIVEAGTQPVELTYELETVGTNGFGSTLRNGYTAHPKYDPLTGEMHAVAYSPDILGTTQYIVVGADGTVDRTLDIATPAMPMIHDMGLTQTQVVVMDLPVAIDVEAAMAGSSFPFRWYDDYDARVGLLPRAAASGDEIVWCSIGPCYAFHPVNSYDTDDGRVIVDICVYEKLFDHDRNGPIRDAMPVLERWTVDGGAGTVRREVIDERFQEFPRVAGSVLNLPYRFAYTASVGTTFGEWNFGPTLKHDLQTGSSEAFDHGAGRGAGEPVFVSRPDATSEDDGWILTVVHDAAADRSDVVVLDALDFVRGEVARVHLPQRVPHGFHGNWVRDTVTPPPS